MPPRSLRRRADRITDTADEHLVTVVVDLDAGDRVEEIGAELAVGTGETNAELLRHRDETVEVDVTGTIQRDGTLTVTAVLHLVVPDTADTAEVDAWSSAVKPDEVASFRLEASGAGARFVARGAILHQLPERQVRPHARGSDPAP